MNKEVIRCHILYLVTNKDMTLQKAFDLVYAELTNAFNDYMISSRKLKL